VLTKDDSFELIGKMYPIIIQSNAQNLTSRIDVVMSDILTKIISRIKELEKTGKINDGIKKD
jgi:hypothetical protein